MTCADSDDGAGPARHGHDHSFADPERIARLRDEAELLAPLTTAAIDRLREVLGGDSPAVILDLGSGPGVGTSQLAKAFPDARVIAVDSAATTLEAARGQAIDNGVGDRVETVQLVLPEDIEQLPLADVCWASMSMHHVGDETVTMGLLRQRLRRPGYLCVVEWDRPFHLNGGADPGRSGWSERLDDAWRAWFAQMRSGLPDWVPSRPYPEMMADAGYEVLVAESIEQIFAPPRSPDEQRFADRWLAGAVERLQPFADPADLDVFTRLLTPADTAVTESDAEIPFATTRTLTIGRPLLR